MHESGYTKLFHSIIGSTIWREEDKTRIVWITMLALVNKYGEVAVSLPGLADYARVDIEACKKAIHILESSDQYSRSQENEGRRIEKCDGGWFILNYPKYRERMRKARSAEYFREYRAGKIPNTKPYEIRQRKKELAQPAESVPSLGVDNLYH